MIKRFCFLLIILFSIDFTFASNVEMACVGQIKTLLKKADKTLPKLREDIFNIFQDNENVTMKDIFHVFDRLKNEEEIFLDTYMNRSKLKRALTDEEREILRKNFKVMHLNDDDIQYFYSNELWKLYSLLDQAIIELDSLDLATRLAKQNDLSSDIIYLATMQTFTAMRTHTVDMKALGARSAEIYSSREMLTDAQALGVAALYKKFQESKNIHFYDELEKIDLARYFHQIQKAFEENKIQQDLCCKTGTGCLFCPNNLGLRFKNKQNSLL